MLSDAVRRMLVAAGVVAYLCWFDIPAMVAFDRSPEAKTYDWCYASCGEVESCATECENDGGGTITCREYNDGPANDWCLEECEDVCNTESACSRECRETGSAFDCETFSGGVCENTCETICNPMTSDGSESCDDDGGVSTDCEAYGRHTACNDGVCAVDAGEVCVCAECAQYCINTVMPDPLKSALNDFAGLTYSDGQSACETAVENGWADGWECPIYSLVTGLDPGHASCAAKEAALAEIMRGINADQAMGDYLFAHYECPNQNQATGCATAVNYQIRAAVLKDDYDEINGAPCYLIR